MVDRCSTAPHDEIDRLIVLCSDISRISARLRLIYLSNPKFSSEQIKASRRLLLAMCGQVEGSNLLLESLIRSSNAIQPTTKPVRHRYTREQMMKIRAKISTHLSEQIEQKLKDVIERETNDATRIGHKSWRDIRTILI